MLGIRWIFINMHNESIDERKPRSGTIRSTATCRNTTSSNKKNLPKSNRVYRWKLISFVCESSNGYMHGDRPGCVNGKALIFNRIFFDDSPKSTWNVRKKFTKSNRFGRWILVPIVLKSFEENSLKSRSNQMTKIHRNRCKYVHEQSSI